MPRFKYKGYTIEFIMLNDIPDFDIWDMPVAYELYSEFYQEVKTEVFKIPNKTKECETFEEKIKRLKSGVTTEQLKEKYKFLED